MKNELKPALIILVLGLLLGTAWSANWGNLGNAYAQEKTLIKKNPIKISNDVVEVYPSRNIDSIMITVQRAEVHVAPTEGDVSVHVVKKDLPDKCEISSEIKGRTLVIIAKTRHGWWFPHKGSFSSGVKIPLHREQACGVILSLTAPKKTALAIESSYADLFIDGRDGASSISTSGLGTHVRLSRIAGDLHLSGVSTDIEGLVQARKTVLSLVRARAHIAWSSIPSTADIQLNAVWSHIQLTIPQNSAVQLTHNGVMDDFSNQFGGTKNVGGGLFIVKVNDVGGSATLVKGQRVRL